MRLTAALLTLVCLAACGGVQTVSEHSPARDDEWRQAELEQRQHAVFGRAAARHPVPAGTGGSLELQLRFPPGAQSSNETNCVTFIASSSISQASLTGGF